MINQSPYKLFKISIAKSSEKFVLTISKKSQEDIRDAIKALRHDEDYFKLKIKKLSGYKDLSRITVSDYRIIFCVNKSAKILNIIIAHRKNVYDMIKKQTFSYS